MKLEGIHILLTYQCAFECEHCFAWGSPWQRGTLTIEQIKLILDQAQAAGVSSIYFEGGEPFLYYASLLHGVGLAYRMGFEVGVVSNGYWAQSVDDALEWLKPFGHKLSDLSLSCDLFHYSADTFQQAQNAAEAAIRLGIPVGTISVAQPEETQAASSRGQLQTGSAVMYRGRAAETLISRATKKPWDTFTACPHEDFHDRAACASIPWASCTSAREFRSATCSRNP